MIEEKTQNIFNNVTKDEIDLIELVKVLWKGRKNIIKITLVFMLIGLLFAVLSQKKYTASTTIVPQVSDKKIGGNLGGLAAMAGIDLGSMGNENTLPATLYPEIIGSIPFQKELIETKLTTKARKEKVSYKEYYKEIYSPGILGYIKKYTVGLPSLIVNFLKPKKNNVTSTEVDETIINVSLEENSLFEILKSQVSLEVNEKDGYLTLSATMPEAIASAELVKASQILLQKYIINFKIKKSNDQLKFIEERFIEKENEFKKIQSRLASYRDRNRNVNSALTLTYLERLQSEYDLAFNIYSQLAQQLESQKIKVKEDTPIFTILKPVSVPLKSTVSRLKTLAIWTILGIIISISFIFGKYFYYNINQRLIKNKKIKS